MRIKPTSLLFLAVAVSLLSSCLNSDDDSDYNYYKDTGISAFTLGTMNRYLHTTTSSGADTVYKTTYTGSTYKMTIDHFGGRIFNTDSLPYGTDTKHVIATITSTNNGYILLKSATSDTLSYYSSTDSMDFSTPRTLRVVAQDGQRYVDYTVRLNARQVPVGTLAWQRKTTSAELTSLDNIKAVACGTRVYAFGSNGGETVGYYTDVNDGTTWTRLNATLPSDASIIAKDSGLYAIANGSVMRSSDGETWTTVASNSNIQQLIATSTKHIYALSSTNGTMPSGILSSADNGATWTEERLDDDAQLLPTSQIGYSTTATTTNDSIDRIMIVGRCSASSSETRTWTKLDDYSSYPMATEWSHVDNNGVNNYALPDWASFAITTYTGKPVALGTDGQSVSSLLQSLDGGLTWKESGYTLPESLTADSGKLAMTADSEGSLWIIANGEVWKN